MSRYDRQIILPQIGATGQAKISAARVFVVGAGGLAASALPLLAGAGVGHLTIMDPDVVDKSNLHRQHLFVESDIGQSKAEAAAARCRDLNSEIAIDAVPERLNPANATSLVGSHDLILDCADSYAVSYILSDECLRLGKPLVSGSALGLQGYAGAFCGGAPSLRAVFPSAPANAANCATAGVLGPVVSLIGAMQAQMALAMLVDLQPSPRGQIVNFDATGFRMSSFRFDDATEPTGHFAFASAADLAETDTIVELRGAEEAPTPIHPDATRIAPETLPDALVPAENRLALCCATGLRAWRTAEQIKDTWPGEIVLVAASAT